MFIHILGGRNGDNFADTLLPQIQRGNQHILRQSFRAAQDGILDKAHAYLALSKDLPPNAAETYTVLLESGVKTHHSFRAAAALGAQSDSEMERALWAGTRRDQSPDSIPLHAQVLAEYVRARLARDGTYTPALDDIFAHSKGRSAALEYMKAVQHALVDHVADAGKDLPLNRGAALLRELRGEIAGSDIWTRKIDTIDFRRHERKNHFSLTYQGT